MNSNDENDEEIKDDCIVHDHPVPPEELWRYSVERDAYSEVDIARYVEIEASDETVQHVERIKKEVVLGSAYEIWDVTTDKDRWWVLTNLTNLYSQKHFPSMDYTLSFHIGLMARLRSRSSGADSSEPTPFDEIFRRMDQADKKHENAIEVEEFQSVGMLLREALISLIRALRKEVELPAGLEVPQDSNFVLWSDLLMNQLCAGKSNKELRQHLKNVSKEAWQLANWLTHTRSAKKPASSIAIHSCQTVVGHFIQVLDMNKSEERQCPVCNSKNIRTHFDRNIGTDGDSFTSCGVCEWTDHPSGREA